MILRDITMVYPDGDSTLTALDGVSLEVPSGEVAAITGESGSGKSTLLSIAAGLLSPTSGEVWVAGQRIDQLDDNGRARARLDHVGVIFQQPNLISSLGVRDQLLITDHMRGLKPRPERADELLALVGLEGMGARKMSKLSGGQRQRVNVARALMADPAVLVADEPTSALDSQLSQEITELLVRVTKELGTATVVVTHDMAVAAAADSSYHVADGKLFSKAKQDLG
ncbi:ABC transporter ATP-binding protein [Corynebacterium phocae]|uniref:ABC transporter ATP-binding protein n=1 Tax=Corynebacterium phocae TaxID=161895 RepID=A0A1L7D5U8_9CORY|nr:ABC transporter ATP-binding protein [Corynebacterium phocae]APT93485.1 ABC transporter ATP-binding protein [Corynebacterium phocae]KAA8720565.1 ABC transporter ATP-binding protein [Corynebacterium phocae]